MTNFGAACVGLLLVAGCAELPVGVGASIEAQKVCAPGPTTLGIDVSHWDGAIDWGKMKAAGVEFAFLKATEGTTFLDPQFATYWKAAPQAGIIRGAFHFFRPAADALKQADFFVDTAGVPVAGDFPLTIDLETTDNLPAAEVAAGALAFLARVEERTGRVPIIYTSARVFDTVLGTPAGFEHYLLWDAQWNVSCPNISSPTWTNWAFWQTNDNGQLGGLSNLDLDQFNGSKADLLTFVNPPVATPDAGPAVTPPFEFGDGGTSDGSTSDGGTCTTTAHGCSYTGTDHTTAGAALWLTLMALGIARLRPRSTNG